MEYNKRFSEQRAMLEEHYHRALSLFRGILIPTPIDKDYCNNLVKAIAELCLTRGYFQLLPSERRTLETSKLATEDAVEIIETRALKAATRDILYMFSAQTSTEGLAAG